MSLAEELTAGYRTCIVSRWKSAAKSCDIVRRFDTLSHCSLGVALIPTAGCMYQKVVGTRLGLDAHRVLSPIETRQYKGPPKCWRNEHGCSTLWIWKWAGHSGGGVGVGVVVKECPIQLGVEFVQC